MKNQYSDGYIYIYNPEQKRFYIEQGCKLIDSDIHYATGKTFWVFKWHDVQTSYKKWMDRKYKKVV